MRPWVSTGIRSGSKPRAAGAALLGHFLIKSVPASEDRSSPSGKSFTNCRESFWPPKLCRCLAVELVGNADDLFFEALWEVIPVGKRKARLEGLFSRDPGPGMAFADQGVSTKAETLQRFASDDPMANIRLGTKAMDLGRIALADSDVVERLADEGNQAILEYEFETEFDSKPMHVYEVYLDTARLTGGTTIQLLEMTPLES